MTKAEPPGLVSWWQAEGNALDALNRNNGTEHSVSYAPGAIGQAFAFGTSGYVSVANPSFYAYSNAFTVTAWIKTTSPVSTAPTVINNRAQANNNGFVVSQLYGAPGTMAFYVNQTGVAEDFSYISAPGWELNTFYHIAATFDAAAGRMALYRNGVLVAASNSLPHTPMVIDATAPFEIGRNIVAPAFHGPWPGSIDEVRFYDRALSPAEVASLTGIALTFVYDLKTDWSDSANPNGPWTYREGNNALPQMIMSTNCGACPGGSGLVWTNAQRAWARSAGGTSSDHTFLPFWFKSNGSETGLGNWGDDWEAGDVVMHTTDPANGIGSGPGNVIWTSPIAGVISIAGNIWIGRDIGRANHWVLSRNEAMLTAGDVSSGDPYSRTNPMPFSAGTAGPSVLNGILVSPGDVIKLEVTRTSSSGDVVGLNLAINAQADCGSSVGWTGWTNGHYYKLFVVTNGITWSNARTAAVISGGYLATIISAEENAFVYSLASSNSAGWYLNSFNCAIGPWLGGFQPDGSPEPAGGFTWVTGDPFVYNNWYPGEPNNSGGVESLLHLFTCGGAPTGPFWNDVGPSVQTFSYMAERDTANGSCIESNGLIFRPFCTNLTVTLSAADTNCVVSTNYMTNATTVLNGIVGRWQGDGNALDSSGNNQHGSPIGITYEPGVLDQAFSFGDLPTNIEAPNGRRVDLGPATQLYAATGLTVSAWVKIPPAADPGSTNNWTYIFTYPARLLNPVITNNVGYGLFVSPSVGTPSRRPSYGIGFHDGTEAVVGSTTVFPDNQWVHLAVTWSSASGLLRMYRNGVLDGTTSAGLGKTLPTAAQRSPSGSPFPAELAVWDFVSDASGALARYGGAAVAIDDFRLYSRELTTNEVRHIFTNEPPAITSTVETNCTVVPASQTNVTFCAALRGKLTIHHAPSNSVELRWPSQTNQFYLLQTTDEVQPAAWTNLGDVRFGTGAPMIQPESIGSRLKRFYRLLTSEP